tara:strand:+ start:4970 stop:5431 length:462 start_codon:yes stop_codon:yes gene_type:complete
MRGSINRENFEKKFERSEGCWEWQASLMHKGYGQFGVEGKMKRAHRVSYTLYVEEIPEGLYVCHTCDNRKCVKPEHLFLGTPQDNMDDKIAKGRHKGPPRMHTAYQRKAIASEHGSALHVARRLGISDWTVRNYRKELANGKNDVELKERDAV